MKHLFIIIFLLIGFISFSQEHKLNSGFKDAPYKRVYLALINGEKYKIIDSAKTDFTGGFHFKFGSKATIGQYRLLIESRQQGSENGMKPVLDFIFNKENISFYTNSLSPTDSMKITQSVENKLYFSYLKNISLNKQKAELLSYTLGKYPDNDEFYSEIQKKINSLDAEQNKIIGDITEKYPSSFIARMVRIDKMVKVPDGLNEDQKNDYLKLHYFDETDFNDSTLIYSSAISNKIVGYLTLYREKQYNRDKQEISFIRAVDHIMKVANKNKKVYEFVLDYLIGGFEKFEFTKVINYIADNSRLEELCQNDTGDKKTTLETKIESYKKFSVGKSVPDIQINDINGKTVKLSDIKTPYTLLLFWASWCPHCEEFIPEIKKVYNEQNPKKFEVLSISIDDKKDEWLKALKKQNTSWLNCAEFKGWDGKTIKDFCIYATPTLYLIDQNKNLIAKPLSIDELKKALR